MASQSQKIILSEDDPTTQYAKLVVAGVEIAGPLVKKACKRHLKDLEIGHLRGLRFSPQHAERVYGYFRDVLCLPMTAKEIAEVQAKGDYKTTTKPFELELQQKFIVGSLFGWLRADGYRRFRTAYVETGKGSGKSPLAAGIGLYMLTADKEQQAEVYSAAPTRDVAKILFRDATMMVEASPKLTERVAMFGKSDIHNIVYGKTQSFFKPISAEGRALDGKRVHCALIDEVHEHATPIVVDKLVAGLKGRMQPLVFMITNSGVDTSSVCYREREYSIRVLDEIQDDDERFAYICALDEGDDWLDPTVWKKANPLLGITIQNDYLERQVREAKGMISKQGIVRRLNFCEWVGALSPWISKPVWDAVVSRKVNIEELDGEDCWLGLDLSGTRDLTALSRYWPASRILSVKAWIPKDTIDERSIADRVPYRAWYDAGYLEATPGKIIQYSYIAQDIIEHMDKYNVLGVVFDEYRIKYLEQELIDLGRTDVPLIKHPQGFRRGKEVTDKEKREGKEDIQLWMPQSVNNFEGVIVQGDIIIQWNPVLEWGAACAVLEADAQGNRKFNKSKATGRIDTIIASTQAVGAAYEKAGPRGDINDFINNPIMVGVK